MSYFRLWWYFLHARFKKKKQLGKPLDSIQFCLRFIINAWSSSRCDLYQMTACLQLSLRIQIHRSIFIYEITLPLYPRARLQTKSMAYGLRCYSHIYFEVPSVRFLCKAAFSFSAPSSGNDLQKQWKLLQFIPLADFKFYLLRSWVWMLFVGTICCVGFLARVVGEGSTKQK